MFSKQFYNCKEAFKAGTILVARQDVRLLQIKENAGETLHLGKADIILNISMHLLSLQLKETENKD